MAKKQLRTVKKSPDTGRLNRDAVRAAVIALRDERSGQHKGLSKGPGRVISTSKQRHGGQVPSACVAGD